MSAECLAIVVFRASTLLSMAEMLASVEAFFSSWVSRRVVIEYSRFCSVAMLDSDCDSLSRSVPVDACELVSEVEDGEGVDHLGSGQCLGSSLAFHRAGSVCIWLPLGCLAENASLLVLIMFAKPW